MTTVDKLGGVSSVANDDLLVLYKKQNRRTRNVSAEDFAAFSAGSAPVQSVNSKTGDVQLSTTDIPEGDNLYYTDARASAAAPVQSVNGEVGNVLLDAVDVGADPAGTAAAYMSAHLSAPDPHPQYLTETEANSLYVKTASNLGAGSGVFASKVGTDIQFKSLVAGVGVSLSSDANTITITASAADRFNSAIATIASSATVDLTAGAPNTSQIAISGSASISAFTVAAGRAFVVKFSGSCVLVNGASIVTGRGANITTAAGDSCIIRSTASNVVEIVEYVAASGLIKVFESAQQTITSGGLLTISHTLGVAPKLVFGFLQCTAADGGYSIGDEVPVSLDNQASNTLSYGASCTYDANNLYVRPSGTAQSFILLNKSTTNAFGIVNASWRLVLRAYA